MLGVGQKIEPSDIPEALEVAFNEGMAVAGTHTEITTTEWQWTDELPEPGDLANKEVVDEISGVITTLVNNYHTLICSTRNNSVLATHCTGQNNSKNNKVNSNKTDSFYNSGNCPNQIY